MTENPPGTDASRTSWRKLGILASCLLLTMIDGFDTQSIGFVGPAIIREWHLPAASLGPIFSAGLFGALFGTIGFGRLGDRSGRLRVLAVCILLFTAAMGFTAWVTTPSRLLVIRFITGVGLGGALPNLLAIAAGAAPTRRRATSVATILIGLPLGSSIGGFASVPLIDIAGWRSVFVVGASVPWPILVMLWSFVRESKARPREPCADRTSATGFGAVLAPPYRSGTLLLWVVTCFCAMLTYTLVSWLPTLLTERGFAMREGIIAAGVLNLGAVIGGLGCGRMSDLRGPYPVIAAAYALGAVALVLVGVATAFGFHPVLVAVLAAAIFALGGQTGVGALSTVFYEAPLRATGVGLALGAGRVGAVLGPLAIGWLLSAGVSFDTLFRLGGAVALVIALLVAVMGRASRSWRLGTTAA